MEHCAKMDWILRYSYWNTGELRKKINPKLLLYSDVTVKNEKI